VHQQARGIERAADHAQRPREVLDAIMPRTEEVEGERVDPEAEAVASVRACDERIDGALFRGRDAMQHDGARGRDGVVLADVQETAVHPRLLRCEGDGRCQQQRRGERPTD
jgi:hypothetical protein